MLLLREHLTYAGEFDKMAWKQPIITTTDIEDAIAAGIRQSRQPAPSTSERLSGCALALLCILGLGALMIIIPVAILYNGDMNSRKEAAKPGLQHLADPQTGIQIPRHPGWDEEMAFSGVALSFGEYDCATGTCDRGEIKTGSTSAYQDAKSAAEGELKKWAASNYRDSKGHTELKATPVTVAGVNSYMTRWKVNSPSQSGYAQVVAIPLSTGGFGTIAVHLNDSPEAPKPEFMDQVIKEIR